MKRFLVSLLAVSALAAAVVAAVAVPASADYGRGAVYQVEITANEGGPSGGGIWLWIELTPAAGSSTSGTGDYAGSDCGHGSRAYLRSSPEGKRRCRSHRKSDRVQPAVREWMVTCTR